MLGVAAFFVVSGAVTLYFAAPTPALTLWHLVALVVGWSVAWGTSFALLRARLPGADPLILPIVALLTGWGLLLLARLAPGFLVRQIIWLLIGCGALCTTALIPTLPRLLRRYRYTLLAGGLLLLAATLIFGVNPSGYGQRLWLNALGVYFQPSEPLKILLVIYLAAYLSDRRDLLQPAQAERPRIPFLAPGSGASLWLAVLGPMLVMVGIALMLLGWQQDLGAALLFYLTFVAMLYLAWGNGWYVLLSLTLFVPVAVAGYVLSSRVALRVSIWLDPWAPEQADRAFQILQSLFALASGGLVGQGLGQGLPTLIPAVHTDFVYAALVEEFGLIGAMALLAMIGLLVYRGILLAQRTESPFESLLAGGIAALIGIQTWVIIGGNAKLIPITGVTLPFLSYGGSSLLTMLVATGLLLNLSAPHPLPLVLSLTTSQTPPLRRTAGRLGKSLLLLLTTIALSTGTWTVTRTEELRAYPTNPRHILAEARIHRGRILDGNSSLLAGIEVDEAGYVTRTYPVPEAAPVVGYATLPYGTAGIEATCDARLRGDVEPIASQSWGFASSDWRAVWDGLLHSAPTGRDVHLTIDGRLQQAAQRLLEGYEGAAILVDARTGEILALASSPFYDPASVETDWETLRDDPNSPLLNRATQGLAQPGGILETVVLATAIQHQTDLALTLPVTAPVAVNGTHLTCRQLPPSNTWNDVFAAQCPSPFARLGAQLGSTQLAKGFEAWGLTDAPVLEIPAVAALWAPENADAIREALGQGDLLVTPLQMTAVAATLGNDGVRPPLHLLINPELGCAAPELPGAVTVVSPEVAAQIMDLWPHFGEAIGHVGDALAGPDRTQTWFIGLNSPRVPRYAVTVLVENPGDRTVASKIGTQLLQLAVGP